MSDDADAATAPRRGSTTPARRRTLLIMAGEQIEVRPLPLAGQLAIGRAADNDVVIDHPSISRRHLILDLADDAMSVTDQGGANGTTLRGLRLPATVGVEISANEPLGIGDLTVVVQEVRAIAAAAPRVERRSGQVAARALAPVVLDARMRRLYELAARVARGTISVLLVGETGTGKEVLAEFVHRASPRASGPLVRINCAAFADSLIESELFGHEKGAFTGAQRERAGLLEIADGGTILLDEVGEMPLALQAKLLRVVEDRSVLRVGASRPHPIDVRFVAATNRDLEAESDAGRFRRDLYFRLAGAVLALPPLRERGDELVELARGFAAGAAAGVGRPAPVLGDDAVAALHRHGWPGNLRELRNVMERAVLLSDGPRITAADLALAPAPAVVAPSIAPAGEPVLADELATLERERIVAALAACQGNQTRAAASLGMPLRTLVKRLSEYGVPRPRKR